MKKLTNIIFLLIILSISIAGRAEGLKVNVVGEGPPMIFIPGLTCDGAVWNETVVKYKDQYQCHIFTLPGFAGNPSIDFKDEYLATMQNLILTYLKEQQIKKPVAVGHSIGGFLVLAMAKDDPDLFSKLIIVDSLPFLIEAQVPGSTPESAKIFAANMKKMMLNQPAESVGATQKAMLQSMINDPKDIAVAAKWGADSDIETVAQAMYELYITDLRDEIQKIESPVLVMGAWVAYKNYGATRENTMAKFKNQYAKIKDLRVNLTDKGKHFIMWDDPEFLFNEIDSFLN